MRMMMRLRLQAVWICALALCGVASAQLQVVGDGGPGPVKAQHLTAEMVSLAPAIAPGGTLQVGLILTMEEHWHVYWVNAGDAGLPPTVKWTLPEGVTAGALQFPIPQRLPNGPLMDYGYENLAGFPVLLTAAPSLRPGKVHLGAKVTWLVCRETCIPGQANLGLDLDVAPGAAPGQMVGALAQQISLLPKALPATMKASAIAGKTDLQVTLVTGGREKDAEFYPFDKEEILNSADQVADARADGVQIRIRRLPDDDHAGQATALPATLHGLVKLSDTEAYEVTTPIVAGELAPLPVAPAKGAGAAAAATDGVTAWSAIGLAFLGGVILNLMPCVFPVLFLKGLALVQSSGEERARMRSHGLVYTLGILVSFWVIVGVLLGLRAGGSQAGWGFQLQSPVFIAVLAAGLFLFALSLAGQFEIGLSLTSVGGELAKKQGYAGSFFTGVLATIVATPCTAPLMGAAIGFALAQPAGITFAVFTALGLGLAMPYLLLTLQPAWTRVLPRPGAWMETLKQLTAVPLFATVIWLAWVYGRLYSGLGTGEGADHIARLLGCFLLLAIAGWALGKWPLRWGSAVAAVLLIAVGLAVPLVQAKTEAVKWQPYTAASFEAARASGHPVFIDFTAAWCLSCQVNERLVLKSSDVVGKFDSGQVTLLKADWTNYDEGITKELASVGRSGVPTYVLYPAGKDSKADVLPELLTKSLVLEALARDGR